MQYKMLLTCRSVSFSELGEFTFVSAPYCRVSPVVEGLRIGMILDHSEAGAALTQQIFPQSQTKTP